KAVTSWACREERLIAGQDRLQKVLIDGAWIESAGRETFQAVNPQTGTKLGELYPMSPWPEVERALQAASAAAWRVRGWTGERFAAFLEAYAARLEQRAE